MKTYSNLYPRLCSYENLLLASKKARKRKTQKSYVLEFEKNLKQNLLQLRSDLLFHSYSPQPLKTFIVRDPKTRKISKSEFRDRIVHHAIINVLEPIYEKIFIHDSFANRKGKGTLAAIKRFDFFKNKVAPPQLQRGYCLKADIRKYFDNICHNILLNIVEKKIKYQNVIFLIKKIINNFSGKSMHVGMPLGNLTSQFFANVYLNELDQFVKHQLKAKYYIRYVDDFVILSKSKRMLEFYRKEIDYFLQSTLSIHLHPTKSKIISLHRGVDFLGFRIFYHHKLLRKSNQHRLKMKPQLLNRQLEANKLTYDVVYDKMLGSIAYAKQANTYNLRKRLEHKYEQLFKHEISTKEVNNPLKMSKAPRKLKSIHLTATRQLFCQLI